MAQKKGAILQNLIAFLYEISSTEFPFLGRSEITVLITQSI